MASYHKELLLELKRWSTETLHQWYDRVWSLRIQLQFGREWWAVAGDMGRSWFVNCDISGVGSNDWFRGGKHQKKGREGGGHENDWNKFIFQRNQFWPLDFCSVKLAVGVLAAHGKMLPDLQPGTLPSHPGATNTFDRLPHQLLIMRMTFRSLDSPRTVRSQSAGKILFLSPKLFPQVSPDSTHPLAGHRSLLQVYLHPF